MAIPFRDLTQELPTGVAAFVRFVEEPGGRGLRAALLLVNARGEPIEFCFTRADMPSSLLWRSGELRRHAVVALVKTLFASCRHEPALVLALAEEVPPRVFSVDIATIIPTARISADLLTPHTSVESLETLAEATHAFWVGGPPAQEAPGRALLAALVSNDLVLEPFERASHGLQEAFSENAH